jgi:hypothetical protein
LLEGLNLAKQQYLDKKWATFVWGEHPLQCCVTLNVHKSCENNLQISNLLQTPVVLWIVHMFVETIQGGCVQTGK